MPPVLVPCPRCVRHVRVGASCPFCARAPLAGVALALTLSACRSPEHRSATPPTASSARDASPADVTLASNVRDAASPSDATRLDASDDADAADDSNGGGPADASGAAAAARRERAARQRARRRELDRIREEMHRPVPLYGAPEKPRE